MMASMRARTSPLALSALLGLVQWTTPAHVHSSPPRAALASTQPSVVRTLDPETVRAKDGSPRAEALRALSEWRWMRARMVAESALKTADAAEKVRLRWVAAVAARNLDDDVAAENHLRPLAIGDSPLSRHAKLRLGGWLSLREPEEALQWIDAVLTDLDGAPSWPLTRYTQRLRATVLARLGRVDDAIVALRRLSQDGEDRHVLSSLAEQLAARGANGDARAAFELYREIAHRWPAYSEGRDAEAKLPELLAAMPPEARADCTGTPVALRMTRAEALLSAYRYLDARDAYATLLDEVTDDTALHCQVRFGHAKALLKARKRSEGAPLMTAVADECAEQTEQRAWARYYAGRAFAALGENEAAVAQYEALEREAPGHRLADDALWRAAKVLRETGDEAGARERLTALPERYPDGDMGTRAAFALGWQARSEGRLADALTHFEALLTLEDREPREDLHGRAAYWRARVLTDLGREADAVSGYEALIHRWPLTYYGQQARARLSDLDPARALGLEVALTSTDTEPLTFAWRSTYESAEFATALELLRVGENGLAQGELSALGLLGRGAESETVWMVAALLDRAGSHDAAVALVRGSLGENVLGKRPVGRDESLWRIAYPDAYAPLIEATAKRFDVPAAYVRAVAREESGFNPAAVSPAHAYGLIQLILPTAEAVAKGLGMRVDAQSLKRPEVNLPVGTRFIAGLASRYRGQYALVPAGYNAGPAAVARWVEERGHEQLDEWIENIPYDETRHYSRRVLQTYGIYTWLSEGKLPRLPLRLPAI